MTPKYIPEPDRKVRLMAQLLTLVFFVFVGLGVYAYSMHSKINTINTRMAAMESEAAADQAKVQKAELGVKAGTDSVLQCTAQRDGLRTQVEAAVVEPPKPVGRTGSRS